MVMKKRMRKMAMEAGAGVLTAAALAAAAAYLLSDKKQRTRAKAWVARARKEVAKNVRKAHRMGKKEYHRAVTRAMKRYAGLHNVNAAELVKATRDMKDEWKRLRKDAKVLAKMVSAKGAKSAKEAAKPKRTRRGKKHGKR